MMGKRSIINLFLSIFVHGQANIKKHKIVDLLSKSPTLPEFANCLHRARYCTASMIFACRCFHGPNWEPLVSWYIYIYLRVRVRIYTNIYIYKYKYGFFHDIYTTCSWSEKWPFITKNNSEWNRIPFKFSTKKAARVVFLNFHQASGQRSTIGKQCCLKSWRSVRVWSMDWRCWSCGGPGKGA